MSILNDNIGNIQVIQVAPSGERLYDNFTVSDAAIISAARVSYLTQHTGSDNPTNLILKGETSDKKLLKFLWDNRHMSPFEMVDYTFRITAPLMVFGHFVRHRTASLNVESFRYTEADPQDVYIPDTWRKQSDVNKQASVGQEIILSEILENRVTAHFQESFEIYKLLLGLGIAREQARVVLPAYAMYTTWIWKIDLRNLLHFLELRTAPNAQYETRLYALAIQKRVQAYNPFVYQLAFSRSL